MQYAINVWLPDNAIIAVMVVLFGAIIMVRVIRWLLDVLP